MELEYKQEYWLTSETLPGTKKKFAKSEEVQKESKNMIMVNIMVGQRNLVSLVRVPQK